MKTKWVKTDIYEQIYKDQPKMLTGVVMQCYVNDKEDEPYLEITFSSSLKYVRGVTYNGVVYPNPYYDIDCFVERELRNYPLNEKVAFVDLFIKRGFI